MAITTNSLTGKDIPQNTLSSSYCFQATKSDTNYLEDPRTANLAVSSRGISIDASVAIKVEFLDGNVQTIPAGILALGVVHPLRIVKVWSTGTGSVNVWIWL